MAVDTNSDIASDSGGGSVSAEDQREPPVVPSPAVSAPVRVLVVGADDATFDFLRSCSRQACSGGTAVRGPTYELERGGAVGTGLEAAVHGSDACIVDLRGPGPAPAERLRSVRESSRHCPAIAVVGGAGARLLEATALEAGAADCIDWVSLTPLALHRAITRALERCRLERALESSEARFAAAFDAGPCAFALATAKDGVFLAVNEAFLRFSGCAREEIVGRSAYDVAIWDPTDQGTALRTLIDDRREVRDLEISYRRRDGIRGHALLSATALDVDGSDRVLVQIVDITDRKRSEDALRESRARLHHLVSASPTVIYSAPIRVGAEGPELLPPSFISENVRDVLGRARGELLGGSSAWMDVVHPDDREQVRRTTAGLLGSGSQSLEYRVRHADGRYRWIHDRRRLLRDEAGNPAEIVGSWLDETDRRETERRLRQVQKMETVGHLAGGIAHELNNLLTVIDGYCSLARESLSADSPAIGDLRHVHGAAERAKGLVSRLLAYGRRQVVRPRPMGLDELLSGLGDTLRRALGEGVELSVVPAAAGALIDADPERVVEALRLLAESAAEAMHGSGTLALATRAVVVGDQGIAGHPEVKAGTYVVLEVRDTGLALGEEAIARVFEPFSAPRETLRGDGLDLAAVYGTVKQSNGYIYCDTADGGGTRFELYWPCVSPEPAGTADPTATAAAARASASRTTILLVDDEEMVRSVSRLVLERAGYAVIEAPDGPQALSVIRRADTHIDLLVTDILMPGMSGKELADHAAREAPGIGVIFVSGYADDAAWGALQRDGSEWFVQKPFAAAELTAKVARALEKRGRSPDSPGIADADGVG